MKGNLYTIGLNYKPVPVVTCKLEYSVIDFEDNVPIYTGYTGSSVSAIATTRSEDFDYFQASVSYAF